MAIRYPAICLVGDPEDPNLVWLASRARRRGFRVLELAEARLGLEWDFSLEDGHSGKGRIEMPTECLSTDQLSGFVVRLNPGAGLSPRPIDISPPATFHAARMATLKRWLDTVAGVVVNRPWTLRSEPNDLSRLSRAGFDAPALHLHSNGRNVRVHTVADRAFGTEIILPAPEHASSLHRLQHACPIPEPVAELCCRAAASQRLWLASFDLRVTPDDEWVCVGMNPAPEFVICEHATGQPIADALLDVFEARALVVMAHSESLRAGQQLLSRGGSRAGLFLVKNA